MSELSEFVEAFQAGYKMTKSKEEREWERELQKMKKEQHAWGRESDVADRDYRERTFSRQESRDAIGDSRWEKEFEAAERRSGMQAEQFAVTADQRERALLQEDQRINTGGGLATDDQRAGRGLDDLSRRENEEGGWGVDPTTTQGIPEVQGMYNPASYAPTEQTPQAAAQGAFNLDAYLRSTRSSESGGNDRAANPKSSARGRYQFLGSTWNGLASKYPQLGLTPDGRYDPEQQERAMLRFTRDNAKSLDSAGIPVTNGNLYAAHFLGDGGARKVLRANPNTPVSRLVGSDVINANPFLSNMTVSDFSNWAERKGNAANRTRKNRTVSMARGGMVAAIPDDDDVSPGDDLELSFAPEQEPAPQQVAQAQETALPEEGPIPAPRYEGTMQGNEEEETDNPFEQGRRAVRDGMKNAMEQAGIRRAEREAIESPEIKRARERYARGYGAGDQQMVKQAIDLVDPEKKLPRSARNFRAIGLVHRYHLENGDYDKAQAAAGQMYTAYKQEAQRFKAIAGAAAADGDIDTAAKAAVAAYASVPNGIDFSVDKTEKGYQVTFTDEETGKPISEEILSPREMAAAAMQMEAASFDDLIMQAAGIKAEGRKNASPGQLSEIETDGVIPYLDENPQIAEMGPGVVREFKTVATDIAGEEKNQMTGGGAAKFLHDMLQFDKDNPDNAPPYKAKEVYGGESYDVTDGQGRTIRMSANGFRTLEAMRESMQGSRTKAAEDALKPGALSKIGESIMGFGGAIKDNVNRIGAAQRRGAASEQPTNLPEMAIPAVDMDNPEIANLLEQEQQLRYQGVSDADPRMRAIREQLDALGVE